MEETKVLIGNSFCQDWAEGGLGKFRIGFPISIFALCILHSYCRRIDAFTIEDD